MRQPCDDLLNQLIKRHFFDILSLKIWIIRITYLTLQEKRWFEQS